jgi:ADP-ribosylglycohydrolase
MLYTATLPALLDNVRERDLDVFLAAHLSASLSFRSRFIHRVLGLDAEYRLVACRVSQATEAGETDVLLEVAGQDGAVMAILVENKIDAAFQPQQAERYRQRGQHGIIAGSWSAYRTCLVAPKQYLGDVASPDPWDMRIELEQIAVWMRELGTPHDLVFARICEQAVAKFSRTSAPVSTAATSFWLAYRQMAKELLPDVQITGLGEKVSVNAPWPSFDVDQLGRSILLIHKPWKGVVDITCYSIPVEETEAAIRDMIPAGAFVTEPKTSAAGVGRSSLIRLKVAPLDHLMPFDEQVDSARVALAGVGLMRPLALAIRKRFGRRARTGEPAPQAPTPEVLSRHSEISLSNRIRGSLVGGAIGDALGAPVEFMSIGEIRKRFGDRGIVSYSSAYGRMGAITDDTQMTLFTADGLLRAWVRQQERGICGIEGVLCHAYLRWLLTQGQQPPGIAETIGTDGWLFAIKELHSRRAPGNTCLAALCAKTSLHDPKRAANDSKGCGGVMRIAPLGLLAATIGNDQHVFELASNVAGLTHGHPSGFLSAGYLAVMLGALMRGASLEEALEHATGLLRCQPDHDEVLGAVEAAQSMAARGRPTPESLETLGGGWVAEEALAISICCALAASDFSDGIRLAVNHSGDSDSTGAITGNILGAFLGEDAVTPGWLDDLELAAEIFRVADDMTRVALGEAEANDLQGRYPGW